MAQNESQLSLDQPRSMFGTWLGVVLLFAVFGLFVWVVMAAMARGDNYEKKRAEVRLEKLKTASDEASTALHRYGWVDKEKGVARIPIERAMEMSIKELAQKKPAPAGPIATPPPVAAPAPAPVGAPATQNVPLHLPLATPAPTPSVQPSPLRGKNQAMAQSLS